MKQQYTIWSNNPPEKWDEGYPIGNGRLAAMVWGKDEDIISLNHEWLWRGLTRERDNEKVPEEVLGQIRDLIDREKFFKATTLANVWLGGEGAGKSGLPNRIDLYQPAGDLRFCLVQDATYAGRKLDLRTEKASVERKCGSDVVCMTSYADCVENVIVCRWSSECVFSGELYYTRQEDAGANEEVSYTPTDIFYECSFDGGICYKTGVKIQTDGEAEATDSGIKISNAKELIAVVDINVFTDAVMGAYPAICEYNYELMCAKHEEKFSAEMDKFRLLVETETEDIPTDERLKRARENVHDSDLILLFYNYGRYLLLASNLCAELPANLQGKWNYELKAPWGSDYHLNINLQMNYWMVEPLGMGTCAEKMLNLIDRCIPHAKKAAMDLYGCRGIWLPLSIDAWARSTPESFGCAVWAGAAPWLAQHYWQRYIYSGDKRFLKERAYPMFREVAMFYEDYMVKDSEGTYQIYPSQSPENAIKGVGFFNISIGKSAAMDVQLAYDSLGYAIKAAEILGVDSDCVERWRELRDNLPDFKIGSDGRLLEWDKEYEEAEPGHRHLSHLYGVYPSDIFELNKRHEQYHASRKSLDYRMAQGGGHTGWSRAWVACLYARFGEGDKVLEHISELINDFATASLLDLYPPRIFQIDGNLGAVAALTEGVAQYHGDKLYLLRALPQKWHTGEIHGFKTPGGHMVDFRWEKGKVKEIAVTMGYAEKLCVVINGEETVFEGKSGECISKRGE